MAFTGGRIVIRGAVVVATLPGVPSTRAARDDLPRATIRTCRMPAGELSPQARAFARGEGFAARREWIVTYR